MYRFRGEPFVYDTLPILTEDCALNEAIGHITIASNATLMPSEECIDILVRNSSKTDVRYSVFECVREEHRKQLIDTLKKNGVNAETYHFIFGNICFECHLYGHI